jgi:hypothetical protein
LGSDAAIGIEATERAVTFLQDTRGLLDEGLDVIDELVFVEFLAWSPIGGFNILKY